MKKIYIIIISLLVGISYSCTDALDNIQDYLDKGETIYVGKLDSLKAFSGRNKIKIEGQMLYGVNQVKCIINWRDPISLEMDSREFPIVREKAGETFEFLLDNLEEGQYDFSVVTYDKEDNQSIPTRVSAYSYGERYQENLRNRIIRNLTPSQELNEQNQLEWVANIEWNISRGDGIIRCSAEYELENGEFATVSIPVEDNITRLKNFKSGGMFRYYTEFMPDEESLDIFTTNDKIERKLPQKSYIGITKDLTTMYMKNTGHPFTGHNMEGNWGILDDWSWNDVIRTKNGAGGAGFATYGGGIVQFESTRWDQGVYENGKIWQTITLPAGKYEMKLEVGNAAHQDSGGHTVRFVVVAGTELPDNADLDSPSSSVLSSFQFQRNNLIEVTPSFKLDKDTQITLGWVVSFTEIHRNIEFKSVRLWSVGE